MRLVPSVARENILVTGGAGYIGSHACKALSAAGFWPIVYDNLSTGNRWAVRWGPFEHGDIRDASRLHDVFAAYEPRAVMHFAALALVGESVRDPSHYYRTNVTGSLALLEEARAHDVEAFVFSSTCAVYGQPDEIPIREATRPEPIDAYGASKLMVERVLDDCARAYGLGHVALRYFNAAGAASDAELGEAREVETHLVPLALEAILGRRPPLTVLGDDYPTRAGTAVRDYIHVRDLAEAHVRALRYLLEGGPSRKLNLGTGRGHSVREVLEVMASVAGQPVPYSVAPRRPGDPPELVADPADALALLGEDLVKRSDLRHIIETEWAWHKTCPRPREIARAGAGVAASAAFERQAAG